MNERMILDAMAEIDSELRLRALEPTKRRFHIRLLRIVNSAAVLLLIGGIGAGFFLMSQMQRTKPNDLYEVEPVHEIEAEMGSSPMCVSEGIMKLDITHEQSEAGTGSVSAAVLDKSAALHDLTLSAAIYDGDRLVQTICAGDCADAGFYYYLTVSGEYTASDLPEGCRIVYTAECHANTSPDSDVIERILVTEALS